MDWTCPCCTYSNAATESACDMCGITSPSLLHKIANTPESVVIRTHIESSNWICSVCEAPNLAQAESCLACTSVRTPAKKLWNNKRDRRETNVSEGEEHEIALPSFVDDQIPVVASEASGERKTSTTIITSSSSSSSALPSVLTSLSTVCLESKMLGSSLSDVSNAPVVVHTLTSSSSAAAAALKSNEESMQLYVSDDLLVEVMNMNCGFDICTINDALRKTGNTSADAAILFLNQNAQMERQLDDNGKALEAKDEDAEEGVDLNDFVLHEYIRDFAVLFPNLLTRVDEFMAVMSSLGVTSDTDRSRAFALLEGLKREREDTELANFLTQDEQKTYSTRTAIFEQQDLEYAKRLERGEMDEEEMLFQEFICPCCKTLRAVGWLLNNCTHCLCKSCIETIVNRDGGQAKCSECSEKLHINDIRAVCGKKIAEEVSEAQTRGMLVEGGAVLCLGRCGNVMSFHKNNLPNTPYTCTFCKAINCFQCGIIHDNLTCEQYKAERNLQDALSHMPASADSTTNDQWQELRTAVGIAEKCAYKGEDLEAAKELLKKAPICSSPLATFWMAQKSHCQLFTVPPSSNEYQQMAQCLNGGFTNIVSCERIQNQALWHNYQDYLSRYPNCTQGFFWHGTRASHPKVVYEGVGFDKKFSRVGGCLWFAVSSLYSMSGFQHPLSTTHKVVLLALVAHQPGNEHVKFIRNNSILNVYENACTYPAYLVTYT